MCLADLAAGYNLLELTPRTDEEVASNEACKEQAAELALEAYNAERGTSLTPDDLWNDEQAQADVSRTAARIECENGRGVFKLKANVVAPDARVILEMQANPQLVDWF